MQTGQKPKDEVLYNLITTALFLGIVVALPLFLFLSTSTLVFLIYGGIPLLLGLWTFLREPENQIKRRKMEVLSTKYPDVENQIITLSAYASLKIQPELLYIPDESVEVFTFGTWKKRYIAISEGAIANWTNQKVSASLLTHEIAHIVSGDNWKTGLPIQYLYWLFGITILVFIRSFPYSLFFKIYDSFRIDLGIADLVTSLTLFVLQFAVLLATRFLYRIKEYAADAFAKHYLGLSNYAKAFIHSLTIKPNIFSKRQKLPFQTNLFKVFGFHPSIQSRLIALQSPYLLVNELPSLLFVAGMFLGYTSGFDFTLDKSFAALIGGEIIIGFLASSIILITLKTVNTFEALDQTKIILKSVLSLGNGAAVAFVFFVGINNLLVDNPAGKMYFRPGPELMDAIFVSLDILLLVTIFIPVLILSFALLLGLIIQYDITKKAIWSQILFVIIAFSPIIGILNFYIVHWWKGDTIYLENFPFLLLVSTLWILFTVLVWRLFSYLKKRFTKREKR